MAEQGRYQPIEAPKVPRLDESALKAEQARCYARAAEIESILAPLACAVIRYVILAPKPVRAADIITGLPRSASEVYRRLSKAVASGVIRRVSMGFYAAHEVLS